jgi:hypothetical protein
MEGWGDPPSNIPDREYLLSDLRRYDVMAVWQDGPVQYRYYPGGKITKFDVRTAEESDASPDEIPTRGWLHEPTCQCGGCRPKPTTES